MNEIQSIQIDFFRSLNNGYKVDRAEIEKEEKCFYLQMLQVHQVRQIFGEKRGMDGPREGVRYYRDVSYRK